MQTWARRGLKTALITGGLLMLGTGIASANENVNPDRPASPLDPQLKVPVRVHHNAVGTPFGQKNLPALRRDVVVSADSLLNGLPIAKAAPVVERATSATSTATARVPHAPRVPSAFNDLFHGNKVTGDMIVPVEIAGNAIAGGGDASIAAASSETDFAHSPVVTDGRDTTLAGNVVNLDWAMPVRVSGNTVAASGNATSNFVSRNTTLAGGDIVTNGGKGVGSGNVVSEQFATPAQVTGNAVSATGIAKSHTDIASHTHAPGTVTTSGDEAILSGTGSGAPVALPAAVHGNAVSAAGDAWSEENNSQATSAGQAMGNQRGPAGTHYIKTGGNESVLSGTAAQPALATPAAVTGDAITVLGTADTAGEVHNYSKAGGSTGTSGNKSSGGGTVAAVPLAVPANAFANSGSVLGLTSADHLNVTDAKAGGDSATSGMDAVLAGTNGNVPVAGPGALFGNAGTVLGTGKTDSIDYTVTKAGGNTTTDAHNSMGSGSIVNTPVALPAEVFGQSAAAGGLSEAVADEHKSATAGGNSMVHADNAVLGGNMVNPSLSGPAEVLSNGSGVLGRGKTDVSNGADVVSGGYSGTTGNDASMSGNVFAPAVALPGEMLGNGADVGGLNSNTVDEAKTSTAGGAVNTNDDAGIVSSNAVVPSLAGPAQVFGNSTSGAGISVVKSMTSTQAKAGGPVTAKGTGGTGSGNVADLPIATPAQVFGMGSTGLGKSTTWTAGDTSSTSGGGVSTDGKMGTLSGNVASLPGAGAGQVFGSGAGVGGNVDASGHNNTDSVAGGDVGTAGSDGSFAGNVASAQALPLAQAFGLAAAGPGLVSAGAPNSTTANSGGDITTTGDRGSISGNLADVPVTAGGQAIGDAASVGGTAVGVGPNDTTAVTGGRDKTSGKGGNLSGNVASAPVGGISQGFGNAGSVVGNATGIAPNRTAVVTGGGSSTSGEFGSMSGNLFAVPAVTGKQVFGNATSAGGHANGIASNSTNEQVGGQYVTDGPAETLSGVHKTMPLGSHGQVFDIPVPVLAHAMTAAPNATTVRVEDTTPLVDLPVSRGGLAIDKLPRLPSRSTLPLNGTSTRADRPVVPTDMGDVNVAGMPAHGLAMPQMRLMTDVTETVVNGFRLAELPAGLPGTDDAGFETRDGIGGVGSVAGQGPSLPHLDVMPNFEATTLNGLPLPKADDITSGSALTDLEITQLLPPLDTDDPQY